MFCVPQNLILSYYNLPTPMSSSGEPNTANMPHRSGIYLQDDADPPSLPKRLIIAVDFGTTYSSVSYVEVPEGCPSEHIDKRSIRSITKYPGATEHFASDQMLTEVPSEVIYPLNPHFRDHDALIPVHNDMKIEPDDNTESQSTEDIVSSGLVDFDSLSEDEDVEDDMDMPDQFYWGYKVHERWALPATHSDPTNLPLARFKLLLDDSPNTLIIREDLGGTLSRLKRKKVIYEPLHVIADYLTYLLDHVQSELLRLGFDDSYRREMVLCVPAIWKPKACRDMQTCLTVAMKRAKFQGVDVENNSIENLFIVSEPEAAAEFIGGLCGSSYLNEDFKIWLKDKLKDETYLEDGKGVETIHSIVEQIMINQFEPRIKRSFDVFKPMAKQIHIHGLRDNAEKKFKGGCITIPSSLAGFLKKMLADYSQQNNCHIMLVQPDARSSVPIVNVVSSGGVYRALNMANGPERIAQSSYGILRDEPYMSYPEHEKQKYTYDKHDGERYIRHTILWVLKRGEKVPPVWETHFDSIHTIDFHPTDRLICVEKLYVSDRSTESHYKRSHEKNSGNAKAPDKWTL
ncbi:hypothetical protein IL306_009924 [Fusarium sp. DS 682]|nr:hypothetical protein IL306_009924 [Fusarium sp. DS 682]